MKRLLALGLVLSLVCSSVVAEDKSTDDWKTIFDGKSMNGWKASENKDSWKVEEGKFVCKGERSHLFYVGDEKPFVNFEFKCDVMTKPNSNAGIYFHTQYQEKGWPKYGYECQVNVTHGDPKKSGGLYAVQDVSAAVLEKSGIKDNEWYTTHIKVEGRHVVVKLNDKVVVDYTEPEGKAAFSNDFERRLGNGTFAFQAHDPKSEVHFKNINVKRLP